MNIRHAQAMEVLTDADYQLGNSNLEDLEKLLKQLEAKEDHSGCVGVRNTIANLKEWERLKELSVKIPIKKEWFKMILSGEKKEEYREIKRHWISRLVPEHYQMTHNSTFYRGSYGRKSGKKYILFHNGYLATSMQFIIEWNDLSVGYPKSNWCPKDTDLEKLVFRLHLGNIIQKRYC